MIIKPKDMKTEEVPHLRGGDGTVIKTYMAPAQPDMHLRLLGRFTLRKGCSIGKHVHDGEVEY
ncbi:MAG: cupin domain-containing protein, partial [Spirochaetales bacterium]|nr:cupin domain-containing protein [Spirochaetales bacterium]